MMQESLLYKLHSNGLVPGVEVDKNRYEFCVYGLSSNEPIAKCCFSLDSKRSTKQNTAKSGFTKS